VLPLVVAETVTELSEMAAAVQPHGVLPDSGSVLSAKDLDRVNFASRYGLVQLGGSEGYKARDIIHHAHRRYHL